VTVPLHLLAAAAYGLAAWFGFRAERGAKSEARVSALLLAGAVVHAAGLVALHVDTPPVPLESFPAALSMIGCLVAVSHLLSLRIASVREVGAWVGVATASLTLFSLVGLALREPSEAGGSGGAWPHAHVLLATLGFSLLALASLAGLGYITKERALKRKTHSRFILPSLESLDRAGQLTLSLGFPLLTLAVASGFAWAVYAGVSPWTGHTVWLFMAWGVYLVPVTLRVRRQQGEKPARSVVIGFLFLAFSYLGVRILGGAA